MNTKDIESALKLIDQGNKMLQGGSFIYHVERLLGAYEYATTRLAPAVVGDRVMLTKTPNITKSKAPGWMGSRHFLIRGAIATVREVSLDTGGFCFQLMFDDESWLKDGVPQPIPEKDKHTYHFREDFVTRAPLEARDE